MMLLHGLARRLPEWDGSVKFAFALGVALLLPLIALGFGGPQAIQLPARVGAFGTLVSLQILFLWANRRDMSPYHQAQQDFIQGDYQRARAILEAIPESSRESVDALVLLGNCYRHLGLYDKCRAALGRALQIKPTHHLALFSRGKLSLVLGDYATAIEQFERALEHGAPEIARFELGQACYLLGDVNGAASELMAAGRSLESEAPQQMMIAHYLQRISMSGHPSATLIQASVDFWRLEAEKHAQTPYGQALRSAIAMLEERHAQG